tara:strand:- start:633 stop:884 length:252 start_codon:yes stop_codon:yes gene_type:complete
MSKKSDYSRLGFDGYQSQDIRILMSLNTKEQIQEWMDAVGPEDFEYALDLLETAAELTLIEDIDAIVETDSSFIDAKIALSGF